MSAPHPVSAATQPTCTDCRRWAIDPTKLASLVALCRRAAGLAAAARGARLALALAQATGALAAVAATIEAMVETRVNCKDGCGRLSLLLSRWLLLSLLPVHVECKRDLAALFAIELRYHLITTAGHYS